MAVIFVDNIDDATAVSFSQASSETMAYIENSMSNFMANASRVSADIRDKVFGEYEKFKQQEFGRAAVALRHKVSNFLKGDTIRILPTVGDIQQAPDRMIRFIMADTTLREMYHAGRIEGYGDRYTDVYPTLNGEHSYDYRRIMDGAVVTETNEDGVLTGKYTNYYEELVPEDFILNSLDRATIQVVQELARNSLSNDDNRDPTSEWNGLIK